MSLHMDVDDSDTSVEEDSVDSMNPFSQAVLWNDKQKLEKLLAKCGGTRLDLPVDRRNRNAIHVAASKPKYNKCLEVLLKFKAYLVDDCTSTKETALHIACESSCEENVRLLLQSGCDVHKKTLAGDTALHIACGNGDLNIVNHILEYKYCVNINEKNTRGCSPLSRAVAEGHVKVCETLLKNGACVGIEDSKGNLPLHVACKKGFFPIARLLLEYEVRGNSVRCFSTLNQTNHKSMSPFMLALSKFDGPQIRFLVDRGAKTEIWNRMRQSAVELAISRANCQILQHVLKATDADRVHRFFINNFPKFDEEFLSHPFPFRTLTCTAIDTGVAECLALLLSSELPRSILQMPFIGEGHLEYDTPSVFPPIAYLFYKRNLREDALNSFLDLFLNHKAAAVRLDEFCLEFRTDWPLFEEKASYIHPFSEILRKFWSLDEKLHYLNLLTANGVTVDYCLQYFYDADEHFNHFCDYLTVYNYFYDPVLLAIQTGDMQALKLFVSSSAILEPVQILPHIKETQTPEDCSTFFTYLSSLTPMYHNYKQIQEHLDDEDIFEDFAVREHFAVVNLKQLCRVVIRSSVREPTVRDNLRHFRKNISSLPLPDSLKDYLFFKS